MYVPVIDMSYGRYTIIIIISLELQIVYVLFSHRNPKRVNNIKVYVLDIVLVAYRNIIINDSMVFVERAERLGQKKMMTGIWERPR